MWERRTIAEYLGGNNSKSPGSTLPQPGRVRNLTCLQQFLFKGVFEDISLSGQESWRSGLGMLCSKGHQRHSNSHKHIGNGWPGSKDRQPPLCWPYGHCRLSSEKSLAMSALECICTYLDGIGQSLKMASMQSRDTVNTKRTWLYGTAHSLTASHFLKVGVASSVNTWTSNTPMYCHHQVVCPAQRCLCCTYPGPAAQ